MKTPSTRPSTPAGSVRRRMPRMPSGTRSPSVTVAWRPRVLRRPRFPKRVLQRLGPKLLPFAGEDEGEAPMATPRGSSDGAGGVTAPPAGTGHYRLSDIRALEAQSIHVFREVAAEFERPVAALLGRQGLHRHAPPGQARPSGRRPCPSRCCTWTPGRNFAEVLEFRDRHTGELGVRLVVAKVQDDIDAGRTVEELRRAPPATGCRRPRCCGPSPKAVTTQSSVGPGATRRRPGPRSASSASATSSASGIPRTSAPSSGTSTTAVTTRASTSGSSHSPTGPSSTCGTTSRDEKIDVPSIYFAHRRAGVRAGRHAHGRHRAPVPG